MTTQEKKFGVNQALADRLDYYVKGKDVDFAFMITGAWGSGKTEMLPKIWTDVLEYKHTRSTKCL